MVFLLISIEPATGVRNNKREITIQHRFYKIRILVLNTGTKIEPPEIGGT